MFLYYQKEALIITVLFVYRCDKHGSSDQEAIRLTTSQPLLLHPVINSVSVLTKAQLIFTLTAVLNRLRMCHVPEAWLKHFSRCPQAAWRQAIPGL